MKIEQTLFKIKYMTLLTIFISLFPIFGKSDKAKEDLLLYEQPAIKWNQALPLGNGRIGAMIFGDPVIEHIQLNDDSLWPSDSGWDEPEGTRKDLKYIRELLFKGKNSKADRIFVEKFSRKMIVRSHQTLGDLFIFFDHNNISDYRRELDIGRAIATVSYRSAGDLISEKVFISYPRKAMIIEFSSQSKKGLNGIVFLSRPKDCGHPTVTLKTEGDNLLIMRGEITQREAVFNSKNRQILNGVKFETRIEVENRGRGGRIYTGKDFLVLQNVKKAVFCLVTNSSFYHKDFVKQNIINLNAIRNIDVKILRSEHIEDYKNLYSRVKLKLTNKGYSDIPTDKRIELYKMGKEDPELEALLFQYGRYLLISSSREGSNPANLQGLWNPYIKAPWNADYHLNINFQMNYWPADITNLGELNSPFFNFVDRLIENGKVTAKKNFGCKGSFIPHATDIWATTWLRAPTAYWGCSIGAGGWLVQHYWQHFEFTKNLSFLKKRVFPALKAVAGFYSDWLVKDPRDGKLISAPSTSPENRFILPNGKIAATCLGSAMDQQIITEVFNNYIKACDILKTDNRLLNRIKKQKQNIRSGFVVGKSGRLLEWDREYRENEYGHRHMSHLYGFHPGTMISKEKTPELFKAVKKTVKYRLENGGAGTGWSRAWLINISARLLDGNMSHKHIRQFIQKSVYDNLFDSHPPFQIDGNFGYTAGVAEMLIQSHEKNVVRILPALPSLWRNGCVKGLRARGGLVFDILWSNGKPDRVLIKSEFNNKFKLKYKSQIILVEMKTGETVEKSFFKKK